MRGRRALSVGFIAALVSVLAAHAATAAETEASSTLEVIRAAHHPDIDRVVFEFDGPVPDSDVHYVRRLVGDPSGRRVPVPGQAVLQVTMFDTVAHDEFGPRAAARNTFPLPNVMSVLQGGDFEGVVTYGIGLAKEQPFDVFTLTNPSRLVIDIDAAFSTVPKQVFFIDANKVEEGTPPYVTPVSRPVLPATPATGVMDRLFAGPTPAEAEAGLLPPKYPSLTERSGATDYKNLRIRNGIARVKLTGGCDSGGSTVTVADEIMPTLKQFDTVDFVKIYDPQGETEQPRGRTDSIPFCLEP